MLNVTGAVLDLFDLRYVKLLLFYREPITLTSLSIVISLQFPHTVRFTDTVLSLEFKDGTAQRATETKSGLSLCPQLLPQSDGGGPGAEAGWRCI